MKLKIINATFAEAVTMPDKSSQTFVSSDKSLKRNFDLTYDTEAQLLFLKQDGHKDTKGVGITNIKVLTIDSETSGDTGGAKAKAK
jgi:hypothetical protein